MSEAYHRFFKMVQGSNWTEHKRVEGNIERNARVHGIKYQFSSFNYALVDRQLYKNYLSGTKQALEFVQFSMGLPQIVPVTQIK